MIGELIVSRVDKASGLRFYIGSRYRIGGGCDPIVGFNLTDSRVLAAIWQRDGDIYNILEELIEQAHLAIDIPYITHEMGLGWEYHKQGGSVHLEHYIEQLNWLIQNPFATEEDKSNAVSELEAIERTEVQTETKRRISKRRRSEFQSKRDQLILALIDRDGYECAECGEIENLSIDHIMPLSKGGSDELDNLRLLCRKHNSAKGDSMPK